MFLGLLYISFPETSSELISGRPANIYISTRPIFNDFNVSNIICKDKDKIHFLLDWKLKTNIEIMDFVISQKEMDHHSTLRRKMVIKNIHHYLV